MDATDHAQPGPKPCLFQPPREGDQHHSAVGWQKCRGKERLRLPIGEPAAPTLSHDTIGPPLHDRAALPEQIVERIRGDGHRALHVRQRELRE